MKQPLKIYSFSFLVLILVMIFTACQKEEMKKETAMTEQEQIEYGKYLVEIGGCHDCHSPKKMTAQGPVLDEDLLLSGHPADQQIGEIDKTVLKDWTLMNHSLTAAVGPWGVSFSANITSDGTGIGNWTYEQFENALRKGWYKGLEGSRPIMPPMPWQTLMNMKDKDMRAIFAYLNSTKPIKNVPPTYIPADQM